MDIELKVGIIFLPSTPVLWTASESGMNVVQCGDGRQRSPGLGAHLDRRAGTHMPLQLALGVQNDAEPVN